MKNTLLWLVQLITGVLIAITLGIHMVWMHLDTILGFLGIDVKNPTSWSSMIERSRESIWAGLYIALLAFVLYHALYGLRNVILELVSHAKARLVLNWGIIVFGALAFIWGAYVPIALLSQ